MTHSPRIVWPLFYTAGIRSSAAEAPDGRFHKSIELGGRAALPNREGGLGAKSGTGPTHRPMHWISVWESASHHFPESLTHKDLNIFKPLRFSV